MRGALTTEGGHEGEDECSSQVNEEDVVGPAFAKIALYQSTEQVARDCAAETATQDCEKAVTRCMVSFHICISLCELSQQQLSF